MHNQIQPRLGALQLTLWCFVLFGLLIQPALAFDHTHTTLTKVLKRFVVIEGAASTVKYVELQKNRSELDAYLKSLSAVKKTAFSAWSEEQRLAFLINAYNGFTLKLIIDHDKASERLKSIKDLGSLFSSPWKKEFFKLFGEDFYLDRIEHKMIRKDFKEPRIHFAVNCASIGCPALANTAYEATKLDQQLEAATVLFLRDRSRNRFYPKKKELKISKIFDWFEEDFNKSGKFKSEDDAIKAFVAERMSKDSKIKKAISNKDVAIEYFDYSWSLNRI